MAALGNKNSRQVTGRGNLGPRCEQRDNRSTTMRPLLANFSTLIWPNHCAAFIARYHDNWTGGAKDTRPTATATYLATPDSSGTMMVQTATASTEATIAARSILILFLLLLSCVFMLLTATPLASRPFGFAFLELGPPN